MENCYKFFENRGCEYYPCHKGLKDFNCLFCYCPMYKRQNCPGNPNYKEINGKVVKLCDGCSFPHDPNNYETIIQILSKDI